MNSSMSPTWPIIYGILILYAKIVLCHFPNPPHETAEVAAGQALTAPTPTVTEPRRLRREEGSVDGVPTYTVTYAPDSVCGYLSGSVEIPITCENKNTCLWELEYFRYIACELDGQTTGLARTKCLQIEEALDPHLCEDDCVSNTYNLLCTDPAKPYCRTYAYPKGVRDYRCASTPETRVSSVDFTYDGQKYPKFVISTYADVDNSISKSSSSLTLIGSGPTAATETTETVTGTTTSPTAGNVTEDDKDTRAKVIAGATVGAVVGLVALGLGVWWLSRFFRGRRLSKSEHDSPIVNQEQMAAANQRAIYEL